MPWVGGVHSIALQHPTYEWPADLPAQLGAIVQVLQQTAAPINVDELAARFTGKRFTGKHGFAKALPGLLAALAAVARAQQHADENWSAG